MANGLQGANTEQMRQLARDFESASQELVGIRTELSQRISHQLEWEGPDAFVFKHAWQSSYAPVLMRAAAMLAESSACLNHQAAEQDATSA